MKIIIKEADLNNTAHQKAIITLLNLYASNLPGFRKSLPESVINELIPGLINMPTCLIFLALVNEEYAGMATCFMGFSTFYARPIINIHDFTVRKEFRSNGIGTALINAVEEKARSLNCCKLTLEVQETNVRAQKLYKKTGFNHTLLDEPDGREFFLSKFLD